MAKSQPRGGQWQNKGRVNSVIHVRGFLDATWSNIIICHFTTMSSTTNANIVKTRHYAALASRLRSLKQNLGESERQFAMLTEQLHAEQTLGVYHGSQYGIVTIRSADDAPDSWQCPDCWISSWKTRPNRPQRLRSLEPTRSASRTHTRYTFSPAYALTLSAFEPSEPILHSGKAEHPERQKRWQKKVTGSTDTYRISAYNEEYKYVKAYNHEMIPATLICPRGKVTHSHAAQYMTGPFGL